MLEAEFIIFQVVEDEADHAHDLLFVRKVKDLGDVLHYVQFEVLEERQSKLVIAQDPQATAHIVCDLGVLLAVLDQKLVKDVEAALIREFLCKLMDS